MQGNRLVGVEHQWRHISIIRLMQGGREIVIAFVALGQAHVEADEHVAGAHLDRVKPYALLLTAHRRG